MTNDPEAGPIETWTEVEKFESSIVSYTLHYHFLRTGEQLRAPCQLRFRSLEQLMQSLAEADFTVSHAFGDWDKRCVDSSSREFILIADRR